MTTHVEPLAGTDAPQAKGGLVTAEGAAASRRARLGCCLGKSDWRWLDLRARARCCPDRLPLKADGDRFGENAHGLPSPIGATAPESGSLGIGGARSGIPAGYATGRGTGASDKPRRNRLNPALPGATVARPSGGAMLTLVGIPLQTK